MKHTSEEIKYRLSDLGVQIGNIAIEYIADLEKENSTLWTMVKEKDKQIGEFEKLPRKVKELEKENKVLAQNLEDSEIIIAGLKAQIEKMKCCANCRHSRTEYEYCRTNKHEKWEIK